MDNNSAYERIVEEYRQVCDEYEEATRQMVALAGEPDCDVENFKHMSDHVNRLAKKLGDLRSAMGPMFNPGSTDHESPLTC